MKNILHSRKSLRLPNWDYSQPGAYSVTVVTRQRERLFGEVVNGKMQLNEAGQIVWEVWDSLPARYPHITIDDAVVMPNHFHGILIINEYPESAPVAVTEIHEFPLQQHLPLQGEERRLARRRMTIPLVMGYFKMNSAKRINELLNSHGIPVWHRNYYEHIVRDTPVTAIHELPLRERGLDAVRLYIRQNPQRWQEDEENTL